MQKVLQNQRDSTKFAPLELDEEELANAGRPNIRMRAMTRSLESGNALIKYTDLCANLSSNTNRFEFILLINLSTLTKTLSEHTSKKKLGAVDQ